MKAILTIISSLPAAVTYGIISSGTAARLESMLIDLLLEKKKKPHVCLMIGWVLALSITIVIIFNCIKIGG